ncbi:MAG: hypothetical protein LUD72_05715 [Bacteroidales bacterium]|nr:hypothetical protein [Bacteroidales bacterium]
MNIIIQDCKGVISFRPDTTREREGRNLFAPDFVSGYSFAPVLFARVCKVGKLVAPKFATRYYDAVNYGLLLYPETTHGLTAIMDRTSFLPQPMYERVVMETGTNVFEIRHNGEPLFSTTTAGGTELIETAVMNASKYMLLRTGDLIAAELAPVTPLPRTTAQDPASSTGPRHHLSATFCENYLFDFHIK